MHVDVGDISVLVLRLVQVFSQLFLDYALWIFDVSVGIITTDMTEEQIKRGKDVFPCGLALGFPSIVFESLIHGMELAVPFGNL